MTHLKNYDIDKVPGLREILNKCQQDIEELTKIPVSVFYRMKFHHLSTSDLTRIVCQVCEVTWVDILSQSRTAHIVIARHLYCYFAVTVQKKSLELVGKILHRDHTSIIHARDKIIAMKQNNDELYMTPYFEIERRIDELIVTSVNQGAKPTA